MAGEYAFGIEGTSRYFANATHARFVDLLATSDVARDAGNFQFQSQTDAPTAPTVALAGLGAGNVDNGTHSYKITAVTATGETSGGTTSSVVTVVDKTTNGQVALTNIATGNGNITARKVYRTVAGDTGNHLLVGTISNNTATTFTDNIADSGLGAAVPTTNTTLDVSQTFSGIGIVQPNATGFRTLDAAGTRVDTLITTSANNLQFNTSTVSGGIQFLVANSSGGVSFTFNGTEQNRFTQGGLLTFGGTSSSFAAVKGSGTTLRAFLADNSNFAPFAGSSLRGTELRLSSTAGANWTNNSGNPDNGGTVDTGLQRSSAAVVTVTNGSTANTGSLSALNLTATGILTIPASTSTTGIIYAAGNTLLHTFNSTTNIFVGTSAGNLALTGINNCGIGNSALVSLSSGSNNTAVGQLALGFNSTGGNNTAVGQIALLKNTTSGNSTAVGFSALTESTGAYNTAVGSSALPANTSGTQNTAVGGGALFSNLTANDSTAVGYFALLSSTGAGNTALGSGAGQAGTANTTGTNNTFIGFSAQASSATLTNASAIGNGAVVATSNTMTLGNTSVTAINMTGGIIQTSASNANQFSGAFTKFQNVTTAGWGLPAIYGSGRSAAQAGAVASVAAYTVGAADGSFLISCNVNVTASTTHSFTVSCDYTDETNTSRNIIFTLSQLAGTLINTITNVTGAGPYEGIPLQIRCKAATSITIKTTGTFVSVTYNVEGSIVQIS